MYARLVPVGGDLDLAEQLHGAVLRRAADRRQRGVAGGLDQAVGDIDAEPVHTAVEPEPQRVGHLTVHIGVVPVEVRLRGIEQVQVPVAARVAVVIEHRRPGIAAEHRHPVVRRRSAVRACARQAVVAPPGVVLDAARPSLGEPPVHGTGVVRHDVDHHLQTHVVRPRDQRLGIGQGAEHRVDRAVVRDVVAAVVLRRDVERGQPDRIDAQLGDGVQALGDARQVADAVSIGVRERTHVHLVHHRRPPPARVVSVGTGTLSKGGGDGHAQILARLGRTSYWSRKPELTMA